MQSILDTSLRLNNEVRKLSELQNLVLVAKKGDKDAFAQLYQHIYKDLYKFAYYVLKNDQDAQDAVSDAVMDVYAGISKLKNADAFRSWMFKILSAKCKRKLKTYVVRNQESDLDDVELSVSGSEESLELKQALSILSDEERMIVSLTVFGGYDSAEIGKMLNLNRNTVRSKHSRALAKMRTVLTTEKMGKEEGGRANRSEDKKRF